MSPERRLPAAKDGLQAGTLEKHTSVSGTSVWRSMLAVLTADCFCIGKPPVSWCNIDNAGIGSVIGRTRTRTIANVEGAEGGGV